MNLLRTARVVSATVQEMTRVSAKELFRQMPASLQAAVAAPSMLLIIAGANAPKCMAHVVNETIFRERRDPRDLRRLDTA